MRLLANGWHSITASKWALVLMESRDDTDQSQSIGPPPNPMTKITMDGNVIERPILFKGEMVLAILSGAKTQTRRLVKPQPKNRIVRAANGQWYDADCIDAGVLVKCPFSKGMRLWVKETSCFQLCDGEKEKVLAFRADGVELDDSKAWSPSIYMPRWASRLTLEITSVRVERLHSISNADVLAEGITEAQIDHWRKWLHDAPGHTFGVLWDSINGKTHPWRSNAWVWVITFRKI